MEILTTPRQLQSALREVASRAQAIDVGSFERRATAEAMAGLVPRVSAELHGAMAVFARVCARCEDEPLAGHPPSGEPGPHPVPGEPPPRPEGPRRVADLSFMARAELWRRRQGIAWLQRADDVGRVIAECESGRRHLVTSAAAVETALSAHEGMPRLLGEAEAGRPRLALDARAAADADDLLLLVDGVVVESGGAEAFFERPVRPRTRDFVRMGS